MNHSPSSSTPSSSCNQIYRSAIALNSLGVSLLERRCYLQARETLKDAISLIRAVFADTEESQQHQTHGLLQETVHAARQRLANPRPDVRHAVFHVDVMTNNNNVSAEDLRSILEDSTSSCVVGNKAFAIRIEDFDCGTTSEFISAILLHNLGLSYYCLSKTVKKASTAERKYLNGAVRLFRISHTLLCKESASAENSSETSVFLPHVMVLVLNTLIMALRENKRETEAVNFCSVLDHLRMAIAESQGMFGVENSGAAAAA